jgi:hypothetical protein
MRDDSRGVVSDAGESGLERLLAQVDEAIDRAIGAQRSARRFRRPLRPGIGLSEGEAFDLHMIQEMWRALPRDLKSQLSARARLLWAVRGPMLWQLLGLTARFIIQRRLPPLSALQQAAQQLQLPRRGTPGLSDAQARQYHRRQEQRGRRPGHVSHPRTRRQREREALSEDEIGPPLNPVVLSVCSAARQAVNGVRQHQTRGLWGPSPERARGRAANWLDLVSRQILPILNRFSRKDIDILLGCLYGVESAAGRTPQSLRQLRAAAAQRLGLRVL